MKFISNYELIYGIRGKMIYFGHSKPVKKQGWL